MARARALEQVKRLSDASLIEGAQPTKGGGVSLEAIGTQQQAQQVAPPAPQAPPAPPAPPASLQAQPVQQPTMEAQQPTAQMQPQQQEQQAQEPARIESAAKPEEEPKDRQASPASMEAPSTERPVLKAPPAQAQAVTPQHQTNAVAAPPAPPAPPTAPKPPQASANVLEEEPEPVDAADEHEAKQRAEVQLKEDKAVEPQNEARVQSTQAEKAEAPAPKGFPVDKPPVLTLKSSVAESRQRARRNPEGVRHTVGKGQIVQGTLSSSLKLEFGDVGLGISDVAALIEDPGSTFVESLVEDNGADPALATSAQAFADWVNSSDVMVSCGKRTAGLYDMSASRLRITDGRGVQIHPVMTDVYDVRFGEGFSIASDPTLSSSVERSIDKLINPVGSPLINLDNWPTFVMAKGSEEKYVRVLVSMLKESVPNENQRNELAYLMFMLSESHAEGDNASASRHLRDVFRVISDVSNGDQGAASALFSHVYNLMRSIRIISSMRVNSMAELVPEGTEPRTQQLDIIANIDNANVSTSEYVQAQMLREVGFPKQYAIYEEFNDKFTESVEKWSSIVEAAGTQWGTDMKFLGTENPFFGSGMSKANAKTDAFRFMYKDFTLSKLFSEELLASYDDEKQNTFFSVNSSRTIDEIYRKDLVFDDKGDALKTDGPLHYVFGLASLRKSKESRYSKETKANLRSMENVKQSVDRIKKAFDASKDKEYIESVVDDQIKLMRSVGPDLFEHFEMNDARKFLASKYGKAILNAKDADHIGGVKLAMLANYRMSGVDRALAFIDRMSKEKNFDPEVMVKASGMFHGELNMLAESSSLWKVLVRDYEISRGGKSPVSEKLVHGKKKYACTIDYLRDEKIPQSEKFSVLSDLVEEFEKLGYRKIKSYEILYQLEENAYPSHPTSEPGSDSLIDLARTSMQAYNGFGYNEHVGENVSEHDRAYIEQNMETVESYVREVAKNPYLAYGIDDDMFADGLCCTMLEESVGNDASHPYAQAFYSMVNNVVSGCRLSDSARCADAAIGYVDVKSLTPRKIIDMVSGKSEIQPYDKEGNLLAIDAMEDLYFNQTFMASISRSSCIPVQDDDGSVIFCRQRTIPGTIESYKKLVEQDKFVPYSERVRAKAMLANRPTYDAMVALLCKTEGQSSKSMRYRYRNANNMLCSLMCRWANEYRSDMTFLDKLPNELSSRLNLSPQSIKAALLKNKEIKEGERFYLSDGTDWTVDEFADNLYGVISKAVSRYVIELREFAGGVVDPASDDIKPSMFEMDFDSCMNFFDVRQALNDARKFSKDEQEPIDSALFAFLADRQDRYVSPSSLSPYDLQSLGELDAMTSLGPLSSVNLDVLSDYEYDNLAIEIPEGSDIVPNDAATDSRGNDMQTVEAMFSTRRSDSSATKDLKSSKYGCHDSDSVTKTKKSDVDPDKTKAEIEQAYAQGGPFLAKLVIARKIKDENMFLGYDDLTLAQCMNIADFMFVESDEQGPTVRPLGMVMNAIKSSVPPSKIDSMSVDKLRSVAGKVVDGFVPSVSKRNFLTNIKDLPIHRMNGRVTARKVSTSRFTDNLKTAVKLWDKVDHERDFAKVETKDIATWRKQLPKGMTIIDDFSPEIHNSDRSNEDFLVGGQYVRLLIKPYDKESVLQGMRKAWSCGNTVLVVPDLIDEYVPDVYKKDLVPWPGTSGFVYMLPFFEIRQREEMNALTDQNRMLAVLDPSYIVLSCEDDAGTMGVESGEARLFKSLTDRVSFSTSGESSVSMSSLFSDTLNQYPVKSYSLASYPEVARFIKEGEGKNVAIDYSSVGGRNARAVFERLVKKFNDTGMDDNGFAPMAKAGEIVAWAQATISVDGMDMYVFAPVIPFKRNEKINGILNPSSTCNIVGVSCDSDCVNVQWSYESDLGDPSLFLMDDTSGKRLSIKSDDYQTDGPMTKDGLHIDMVTAPATPAERRDGRDRRLLTMETLMCVARLRGYNFADSPTAFPDADPQDPANIKNRLRIENVSFEEWENILSDKSFRFSSDSDVNAFLSVETRKFLNLGWNPTNLLASGTYSTETGEFVSSDVYWEFGTTFKSTPQYQDLLMKFMHAADPELCPDGLYEQYSGELFRVSDSVGPDANCLQMEVSEDIGGRTVYSWKNVYAQSIYAGYGLFNLSRSWSNGSDKIVDSLNAMALSGQEPAGIEWKSLLKSAFSDKIDPRLFKSSLTVKQN